MSALNKSVLVLLLASLAGCGQQLVEFRNPVAPSVPSVASTDPANAATSIGVSRTVNATFSEQMDPATITASTFTLKQGSASISGTVSYAGMTATFRPSADLAANTVFTATVTASAKSSASGTSLAADFTWSFTTAVGLPPAPPTVTSTDPGNSSTGVATNKQVSASFSRAMDPATINTTTFTMKQGTTPIAGAVSYAGTAATFAPTSLLATSTTYVATISTGAKDGSGLGIAADYSWSFATGPAPAPPAVVSTDPGNNSTGVANNKQISAVFNRAMDPATVTANTFTLKQGVNSIAGAVSYAGTTATFVPTSLLADNTNYSATITTGAKDGSGLGMASNYNWSFSTGSAPAVLSTDPVNLATGVATNKQVSAIFSKAMDPATITALTFTLKQGASPIAGAVSYAGQTATFAPNSLLLGNTNYAATITKGAKDGAGAGINADYNWSFTTIAPQPPPLAINLRGIASYGLASRAGLTSTGVTVINGNVAIHPTPTCTDSTGNAGASQTCLVQTYSSPTGLTVNGKIYYFGDPFDNGGTANSVTNDLQIAWNEGKSKVPTQPTVAGDQLALKTFVPGVYHNANLGLSAGGIATMDASGDANAVFIFQVDSSFTDSGTLLLPTQIKLINGAQARNVWFVVGLDITIGSGTTWNGTILAGRTATINNGSTVTGRVLGGASGAGAVTLTGAASPSVTTITVPQ
jgi:tetrahydromethanopterin S-methyltransferase subunit B